MSADAIVRSKEFRPEIYDTDILGVGLLEQEIEPLAGAFVDKGFDQATLHKLADTEDLIGGLIGRYYLGNYPSSGSLSYESEAYNADIVNRVVLRAIHRMHRRDPTYTGDLHDNREITQGEDYRSYHGGMLRDLRRNGAQRTFRSGLVQVGLPGPELRIGEVPIAVVGGGAAGTLTARAFLEAGFHDVSVFDIRGQSGGIWNQDNVANGSKNNPFDLRYDGVRTSSARDLGDPRGTGRSIQRYIHTIGYKLDSDLTITGHYNEPVAVEQAIVRSIEPGDLEHVVRLQSGSKLDVRTYPIVVYAPGIGRPLPLSHEGHMTTTASRKEAGNRWQQQLSDEKLRSMEGQRIVFIGAGNSTAEMVFQLQDYVDRTGREIDYRIITHYPHAMTRSPNTTFADRGKVYRNIDEPELTKLAGDLPHIQRMYDRAFNEGKIIDDVRSWHVEGNSIVMENRDGIRTTVPMDGIYTLTGYGQDPSTLDMMGITCLDEYYGTGAFDFDGEVQSNPGKLGRARLYAGYFAIGPIMKSRYNPNALVIPGIQGQLNNLFTSATVRAAEYAMTHPRELEELRKRRLYRASYDTTLALPGKSRS